MKVVQWMVAMGDFSNTSPSQRPFSILSWVPWSNWQKPQKTQEDAKYLEGPSTFVDENAFLGFMLSTVSCSVLESQEANSDFPSA